MERSKVLLGFMAWCMTISPLNLAHAQTCSSQTAAVSGGWATSGGMNYPSNEFLARSSVNELLSIAEPEVIRSFALSGWTNFSLGTRHVTHPGPWAPGATGGFNYDWSGTDIYGEHHDGTTSWVGPIGADILGTYYCANPGYELVNPSSGAPYCELKNVNLRECPTDVKPDKERGCNKDGSMEGNPCNVGAGNKFQIEEDYAGPANSHLNYSRYYNSDDTTPVGSHGKQWRGSFDRRLTLSSHGSFASVYQGSPAIFAYREDGTVIQFWDGSTIIPKDAATEERLISIDLMTWQLTDSAGNVETYSADSGTTARLTAIRFIDGRKINLTYNSAQALSTVSDEFGHKLTFTYNTAGRITKFTDPANKSHTYTYNTAGYLTKITYPDTTFKQYTYSTGANESLLLGIIDESGATYASWSYDTSKRVTSSQHAGGAEAITIAYNADGSRTVTDALGSIRTYQFDLGKF